MLCFHQHYIQPFEVINKASRRELLDRLEAIALRYDTAIANSYIESAKKVRDLVTLEQMVKAIESGRFDEIPAMYRPEEVTNRFEAVALTTQAALIESGNLVGRLTDDIVNAQGLKIEVRFDTLNPATARLVNDYKFNLITRLTNEVRESVSEAVRAGVIAGKNPYDTARRVRQYIGLTDMQVQQINNYRAQLESPSRAALRRSLRDKRFDRSVAAALRAKTSIPQDKIDIMVQRYSDKQLAHRAKMIARTESIRAVNGGNYALWQQLIDDGKIRADQAVKEWIYTHDSKVRPWHSEIPSINGEIPLNEPFQSSEGAIMYPGDPSASAANTISCRCSMFVSFKP